MIQRTVWTVPLILVLIAPWAAAAGPSVARAKAATLVIPTYETLEADVLAPLVAEMTPRGYPVYPYPLQEQRATEKHDKTYDVLLLENDYVRLTFLPSLGGHLLSMVDKTANREVLFANPVIKPVLVGLRGAWASTGIEFNFPGSHSVTSHSPVKCSFKQHDDGSASVTISDIEWVSGMQWRVRFTLRADSSAVEQESAYLNRTSLPHRAYFWTNAAIPAYPDSEFVFPATMRRAQIHPPMDTTRIHQFDFPRLCGIDVGKFCNVFCQFPLFPAGLRENWFGCYHTAHDAGLLHWADCGALPGRKIWTFGSDDHAKYMYHSLGDEDQANIEVQSGPLELQTDFMLCPPGVANLWKECWLPVSKIKHPLHTDANFSLGFSPGEAESTFHLFSYRTYKDLTATVQRGDSRQTAALARVLPGTVQPITLTGRNVDPVACRVLVKDSHGQVVFRYDPAAAEKRSWTSSEPITPGTETTAEGWHLKGVYREERGEVQEAMIRYRKALEVDPGFSPALTSLGSLYLKQGLAPEAAETFEKALRRDRRNAAAHFYLGLARAATNDSVEASYQLGRAAMNPGYRLPATAELAAVRAKTDGPAAALAQLRPALYTEEGQVIADLAHLALLERAMVYARRAGRGLEADALAQSLRTVHQDNLLPVTETFLASHQEKLPAALAAQVRECPRLVLWAILYYIQLHLDDDARALTAGGIAAGSGDPMVHYVAASLALRKGDQQAARAHLNAAESVPTPGVFPDSIAMLTELQALAREFRDAPKVAYYIGLIQASVGRWDDAGQSWAAAVRKGLREYTVFRNVGLYNWKHAKSVTDAVRWYQRGFDPATVNYKYVCEFDAVLAEKGSHAVRRLLFEGLPESLRSNGFVAARYAAFLVDTQQHQEAIALLSNTKFAMYEGKRSTHQLFAQAHLALGEQALRRNDFDEAATHFRGAMSYPWNLGVGKAQGRWDMKAKYLLGVALHRKGDIAGATKLFSESLAESQRYGIPFVPLATIRWEADSLADDAIAKENLEYEAKIQSALAQWKQGRTR